MVAQMRYNGRSPLRRSDIGNEGLSLNSSLSKQCVKRNVSEAGMNTNEKRKKVRLSEEVTTGSVNIEAHSEPAIVKRKLMTGQRFKSWMLRTWKKETVREKSDADQSEKLPSYQGTEVLSDNSKKQCLKPRENYSRDSQNTIESGRDLPSAEEDIDQQQSNGDEERQHSTVGFGRDNMLAEENVHQLSSNVDKEKLSFSSLKLENEGMYIEKDSAKGELHDNQILTELKQVGNDKGARDEIVSLLNTIQRKCKKRMKKLLQKQEEKIRIFDQIWEENRLKLEKDHKLDSALIRAIYREDSATINVKLKLLDDKFANQMEETILQKNVQCQKLEAKLLTARNEERRKQASWLADAKGYSSRESNVVLGSQSLASQSEEVDKFSQSTTQDAVHITRHHVEDKYLNESVEGNNVSPSKTYASTPAEEVFCDVPVVNSSNFSSTDPQNELFVEFSQRSVLAGCEQLNQPKDVRTREIIGDLPASREIVPVQVPPEVPAETVPNDIDHSNPMKSSDNSLINGLDKGDDTSFPLVGNRLEPETVPIETIHNEIRPVELSKEVPQMDSEMLPNEIVNCANPLELSNKTSDKGIDTGYASGLLDSLVNQGDETDATSTSSLPLAEQESESPEQAKASPNHCALLLEQVSGVQIHQGSTSTVIQDQVAQVVEKHNTSLFEVTASEHVNSVTITTATAKIIDTVIPVESIVELQDWSAPAVEDEFTLRIEFANLAPVDSVNAVQVQTLPVFASENVGTVTKAPAVDDEVTLQIKVANLEPLDSVNAGQDQSSQVVEKQNSSPFELVASENINPATSALSHTELHERDAPDASRIEVAMDNGIVTHEESSENLQVQDAAVVQTESCEVELESPNHNPEKNSLQAADISESDLVPHETASPSGEIRELQSNHFHIGSENQIAREINIGLLTSSQNNVPMSETVTSATEFPVQAGVQLGRAGRLYRSSFINSHPNHQLASRTSPLLFCSPLADELEKISKETEQLQKVYEDMKVQLESDCEKEVQEVLAQVKKKYDLKLLDAEAKFSLKKNGLEKNRKKVRANLLLAEVGLWNSGLHGTQQAFTSSSFTPLHYGLMQQLVRPPTAATAVPPAPSQPITIPNLQSMQQSVLLHSERLGPVTRQDFTAPLVQTAQHTIVGPASRPPVISAITPAIYRCFSGEIRSTAPHLQPPATSSTHAGTSLPLHPSIYQNQPQL